MGKSIAVDLGEWLLSPHVCENAGGGPMNFIVGWRAEKCDLAP
jgi:hypothetical protein